MALAMPPPQAAGSGCNGPASVEELVTSLPVLDTPCTLSELIERIGECEQAKISRAIEAEIERINEVVEKHRAARARDGAEPEKDQILDVTADELRAEISQSLYMLGDRARQDVEALTLGALRQLPPDYRALSIHDAFRLKPGWPVASKASSVAGETGSSKARDGELQQILARMQETDKLKDQIASATAQLERLSSDERRTMVDNLKSRSESIFSSLRVGLGALGVSDSGGTTQATAASSGGA
mmetsp:Transcript_105928/g.282120  ORF Transcript_105928/g.282120 Transcript_105928/m.282120 type:complete len:243 (-) Transcript_105928:173-901(-)|eukprot:CAMPEP_0171201714 /NCGR_PEP_ID=MMETSP0790-20130122/24630_1 /TAXON_ID=2925 /ORGANISM="Alexandrium catenella, Strain OF101" /LENGTH=242 /DNA_ID=CAMNT_0011667117 /DNA_START=72 /DNA_END=800 /DNA_ORIENTATION=-